MRNREILLALAAADERRPVEPDKVSPDRSLSDRAAEQPVSKEDRIAAQVLAARIKRSILRLAPGRIQELHVDVTGEQAIVLSGRCGSFYCKQLAQHAAMQLAHGEQIENRIQVV